MTRQRGLFAIRVLWLPVIGWQAALAGVHPPAGADASLILTEETARVVEPPDFGFSDLLDNPADRFTGVICAAVPGRGSLRLAGEPVVPGQFIPVIPAPGYVWTPGPVVLPAARWGSLASSADGVRLVFADSFGFIQISGDGGDSWTQRADTRSWTCVASSTDGQKLVAADSHRGFETGLVFTSTDAGVSWNQRRPILVDGIPPPLDWTGVASSANGVRLTAAARNQRIQLSSNGGIAWLSSGEARDWRAVASSADGTRLVAVAEDDLIYVSGNAGVSWTPRADRRRWRAAASSADGLTLIAGTEDGWLSLSLDGGTSWSYAKLTDRLETAAVSSDGSALLAAGSGILHSTDRGATWAVRKSGETWTSVSLSADGSRMAAVSTGALTDGGVFTSVPAVPALVFSPAGNETGDPYASLSFQVSDDGSPELDPIPNTLTFSVINVNDPPVLTSPLPDLNAPPGKSFVHAIPAGAFADPDPGDVLTFAASQGDGSALPAWLSFEAESRTFRGTPLRHGRGMLEMRVTVTDAAGASVVDAFLISVAGIPSGTDRDIFIDEDTPYDFTPADFPRRTGSLLTVTPQFSANLVTWEATGTPHDIVAGDGLIEACIVKFPETLSNGTAPRFARLAITTP